MKKKIEIKCEGSKYFACIDGGYTVPLSNKQAHTILETVVAAISNEILSDEIEGKEDKKVSVSRKSQERPEEGEMEERRKLIASLHKKNKSRREIKMELTKRFPTRSEKTLLFTIDDWFRTAGLKNSSKPFNKYLAEHDYKVPEEELGTVAEEFGINPQDIKREVFKIRSLLFI